MVNENLEAPEENLCQAIADEMGMYFVQSGVKMGMGIMSKHKITKVVSNEKSVLAVQLANGKSLLGDSVFSNCIASSFTGVTVANVHFTDEPCTLY